MKEEKIRFDKFGNIKKIKIIYDQDMEVFNISRNNKKINIVSCPMVATKDISIKKTKNGVFANIEIENDDMFDFISEFESNKLPGIIMNNWSEILEEKPLLEDIESLIKHSFKIVKRNGNPYINFSINMDKLTILDKNGDSISYSIKDTIINKEEKFFMVFNVEYIDIENTYIQIQWNISEFKINRDINGESEDEDGEDNESESESEDGEANESESEDGEANESESEDEEANESEDEEANESEVDESDESDEEVEEVEKD